MALPVWAASLGDLELLKALGASQVRVGGANDQQLTPMEATQARVGGSGLWRRCFASSYFLRRAAVPSLGTLAVMQPCMLLVYISIPGITLRVPFEPV